jgi:serine/threonine protein kinase
MNAPAQTPHGADPYVGRVIGGKYRVEQRLGAGAMGTVYRAVDASGARCAVKVLQGEASADPDLRERFRREAEAMLMIQHPNILEVRDYGIDPQLSAPFLVMELLEGRSLEEMVVEHTPDPQTGLDLAKQVCRGLACAHAAGVLHRDLKTENVFVIWSGSHWVAKLLDFGLAKLDDNKYGPARKLTMQGAVFGSPAYMSPEQGTGSPMDARADVYSMGVVLYEMLAGAWPFEMESQMAMLRAHLLEPPPPLASKREGLVVVPALDAIVHKALAKKPSERYPSAVEMLAALDALPTPAAWIAGMTHVPQVPIAPPPAAPRAALPAATASMPDDAPKRGSTAMVIGGLAVTLILVAVVAAALFFLR